METKILSTSEKDIKVAAEIIRSGGLVAFPTETVYGLGANALDPEAVAKVYMAKGRPSDNPMIVHISHKDDMRKLTELMTRDMECLMDNCWPGPLTMVVPAKDIVPRVTTGGLDTVAVRMPSAEAARALISESGVPIAAPSANLSGHPSPTTAQHCIDDLMGRVVPDLKDYLFIGPFSYANASEIFSGIEVSASGLVVAAVVTVCSIAFAFMIFGKRDLAS